jgi:Domain of unknown function (DUF4123)
MPFANPDKVIDKMWPLQSDEDTKLYAVLDGARNDAIYPGITQSDCEFECLYLGELEEDVAQSAPYLIQLDRDKEFTHWLVREGWGDSWGIFIQATIPFKDLKRHLRKFLMVYDPNHKPLYFRYYDPRVLRIYLPTCNAQELGIVFGQIKGYVLEDQNSDTLLRFANNSGTLATDMIGVLK